MKTLSLCAVALCFLPDRLHAQNASKPNVVKVVPTGKEPVAFSITFRHDSAVNGYKLVLKSMSKGIMLTGVESHPQRTPRQVTYSFLTTLKTGDAYVTFEEFFPSMYARTKFQTKYTVRLPKGATVAP